MKQNCWQLFFCWQRICRCCHCCCLFSFFFLFFFCFFYLLNTTTQCNAKTLALFHSQITKLKKDLSKKVRPSPILDGSDGLNSNSGSSASSSSPTSTQDSNNIRHGKTPKKKRRKGRRHSKTVTAMIGSAGHHSPSALPPLLTVHLPNGQHQVVIFDPEKTVFEVQPTKEGGQELLTFCFRLSFLFFSASNHLSSTHLCRSSFFFFFPSIYYDLFF